jgi:hypothetical protein
MAAILDVKSRFWPELTTISGPKKGFGGFQAVPQRLKNPLFARDLTQDRRERMLAHNLTLDGPKAVSKK